MVGSVSSLKFQMIHPLNKTIKFVNMENARESSENQRENEEEACRLCLKDSKINYDLLRNSVMVDELLLSFNEVILYTLEIKINDIEGLSTKVCNNCMNQLLNFYVFKKHIEDCQLEAYDVPKPPINRSFEDFSDRETEVLNGYVNSFRNFILKGNICKLEILENDRKFEVSRTRTFNCSCGERFLDESQFQEHICELNTQIILKIAEESEECVEEEYLLNEHFADPEEDLETSGKQKESCTCFDCGKYFQSQSGLNSHIRLYCQRENGERTEEQKQLFTCRNCGVVALTAPLHFRHLSKCKGKNGDKDLLQKVLYCPSKVCSKSFKDLRALRNHANTCCPSSIVAKKFSRGKYNVRSTDDANSPSSRFCQFCNLRFDQICQFSNHLEVHKAFNFLLQENYLNFPCCNQCHSLFRNSEELENHECYNLSECCECGVCTARYPLKEIDTLKQHMFFKHWTNFMCPIESCKVDLKSPKFYYFHIQMRHPGFLQIDTVFRCQYCEKVFESYPKLSSHRKKDCKEKNFSCSHCDRVFGSSVLLNAHIFKVNNPFICKICNKTCNDSSQLKIHMRIHTKDRPYQCNICMKTFSTASQRSAHADKHNDGKMFKCHVCYKWFQTRINLQSHLKNHTGSVNCPICGNLYASQKSLECHIRNHKNNGKKCSKKVMTEADTPGI